MTEHLDPPPFHKGATPPGVVLPSLPYPGGRDLATVLVVDDNPASIELARIMLMQKAHLQCNLECAAGGDEALAIMRALANSGAQVDLVLLDINMPRLDGFEVLAQLASDAGIPKAAVVMCTTSSERNDIERAFALGASGYVEKPPRLEKLRPLLVAAEGLALEENDLGAFLLRAA